MKPNISNYTITFLLLCIIVLAAYFLASYRNNSLLFFSNNFDNEFEAIDEAMSTTAIDEILANEMLEELIKKADDNLVYERALREYSRNMHDDSFVVSLESTILLATDERIRYSARAGAIETLAEYYMSQFNPISVDEFNVYIRANSSLNKIVSNNTRAIDSATALFEYANQLSTRPLSTAYLMLAHAKELHVGDVEARTKFDVEFGKIDLLIQDMSSANPNLGKVNAVAASALLYIVDTYESEDNNFENILDNYISSSISESKYYLELSSQMSEQPISDFIATEYAPLAQFYILINESLNLKSNNYTIKIKDLLNDYLNENPDIVLSEVAPNLYSLTEQEIQN